MSKQSTTAHVHRHGKRQQLRELVARLGQEATGALIREHAYREGIGQIHPHMLVSVRNELWPNRPKRACGQSLKEPPFSLPVVVCQKCGSEVVRTLNRHILTDGTVKRKHRCKSCGEIFTTISESSDRIPGKLVCRLAAQSATEKECTNCKRVLPVSCFGKRASDSILYRSWCRDCANSQRVETYRRNDLLAKYGITQKEYEAILDRQGGTCAICGTKEPGCRSEFFTVDHCHQTNAIRGLLCNKCNLGIGNFNDDPERLKAAAHYLCRQAKAERR